MKKITYITYQDNEAEIEINFQDTSNEYRHSRIRNLLDQIEFEEKEDQC